jgi:hypothetical protein
MIYIFKRSVPFTYILYNLQAYLIQMYTKGIFKLNMCQVLHASDDTKNGHTPVFCCLPCGML